jgi:peptidoglycan/LPS O-acetylase OafA/YrhL
MQNISTQLKNAWQLLWDCRGLLAFLGIVIHSARIYAPAHAPYALADASTSQFFQYMAESIHAFRMEGFFVLSGAAAYTVLNKNSQNFLANRTMRLLVPFVVTALLLNLPIFQFAEHVLGKPPEGIFSANIVNIDFWLAGDWMMHLWFIRNLIFYTFIYAALARSVLFCAAVRWLLAKLTFHAKAANYSVIGLAVALVALLPATVGFLIPSFHEPILGKGNTLLGTGMEAVSYFIYFGAGLLLARKPEALLVITSTRPQIIVCCSAICALNGLFAITGITSQDLANVLISSLLSKVLLELFQQCSTLSLLYLVVQCVVGLRLIGLTSTMQAWAKASYTIYLVHLPVIWLFSLGLRLIDGQIFLKFCILVTACLAVCLAFHSLIVNGRVQLTRFLFTGQLAKELR